MAGTSIAVILGECPCCSNTIIIPVRSKDWTECPGCERRFRVSDPVTGSVEMFLSEKEQADVEEWNRLSQDVTENPTDYVPCWRDDCEDGFEVVKIEDGVSIVRGICIECDGHTKVRRS